MIIDPILNPRLHEPPHILHVHSEAAGAGIWTVWNTDLSVLAPLALFGALYGLGVFRLWRRAGVGAGVRWGEAAAYAAGWFALFVALVSPLDALGGELFSAHMAQHEIMMLIAAPLLVISRPIPALVWGLPRRLRRWAGWAGKSRLLSTPWAFCSRPLLAWSIHAAVLWTWHIPFLFQAALTESLTHIVQHLAFLFSAVIFWWAMLEPRVDAARRLSGVLYIFSTAVHTSILGALLTFSTTSWYPVYASTTIARGLTATQDQQLGGLIMWVPGGVAFMLAALLSVAGFFREAEASSREGLLLAGALREDSS